MQRQPAYVPPRGLRNPHFQTIWAAKVAARPTVCWHRERWNTPDGDFIDADWLGTPAHNQRPVLVLFHGLEGGSTSHYAQAMAQEASGRGWDCVVPHFRGCSGELNRAPRAYHSGDHAEVGWILAQVAERYPGQPRLAAGVSLGGNALMVWAGRQGAAALRTVQAVASICSPLDLMASGAALEQGLNRWIYTPMFLRTMQRKAVEKSTQFPGLFDLQRALAARTLRTFDDAFTAPVHGFAGVEHYWTEASGLPHLRSMAIPALVLHAEDDPFVPKASLPRPEQVSPSVALHRTPYGGHVGFPVWDGAVGGWRGHVGWMPGFVCQWLHTAVERVRSTGHG